MAKPRGLHVIGLAILAFVLIFQTAYASSTGSSYLPGQVIVKYKQQVGKGARSSMRAQPTLLRLAAGETVEMALERLSKDPSVEFVEPNYIVRGTQGAEAQASSAGSTGDLKSWGLTKIGAENACQLIGDGIKSANICIIDSGTDCRHPDLKGNCADGFNVLTGRKGIVAAQDDNGHGTQVAGVLAAGSNSGGTVGVAPVSTRILSCKFMNSAGVGSTFDANKCLQWCLSQGARVSVNAWGSDAPGGAQSSNTLRQTLQSPGARNHLFITSAGNTNSKIGPSDSAFYPALLSLPNMLVVGATDASDKIGTWTDGGSNYNPSVVDIGAPGVGIVTDDLTTNSDNPALWYRSVSGSSVAAAFTGGATGLLLSVAPDAKASTLKEWILSGAKEVPALDTYFAKGRRLNVESSVRLALAAPRREPNQNQARPLSENEPNPSSLPRPNRKLLLAPIY